MSPLFIAFLAAAALLTVAPGLDTAFVLRTAAVEGWRSALLGALGILIGCLLWAAAVAVGVGAVIAASEAAYAALRWAGAAYLLYLGVKLILTKRRLDLEKTAPADHAFSRGLLTNLLNPKVGVFYVSFLPQFVPEGAVVGPYVMFLALVHAAMGAIWFLALIAMTQPLTRFLKRAPVIRAIDRLTGGLFIGFAALLAFEQRR